MGNKETTLRYTCVAEAAQSCPDNYSDCYPLCKIWRNRILIKRQVAGRDEAT